MPDITAKNATARQVEMFVRSLNGLSTFPQVAAAVFELLWEKPLPTAKLAELVQSDPALTVCVLSLAAREKLAVNGSTGRIDKAIELLPVETLREAILAIPVCREELGEAAHELLARTDRYQLTHHALAVACAASRLAQEALSEAIAPLAFAAGLLHDLGKLALVEVMPRSFAKLVKQAQQEGTSLARVEQQHLGMDHTRIGKQLAEKWHLPEPIQAGIWLHHSDPALLVERFPSANMAQVIHLANLLARKSGLGDAEDPYGGEQIRTAAFSLKISMETVERIGEELAAEVQTRCALLGIAPATSGPAAGHRLEDYYRSVHTAAAVLARENRSLASLAGACRTAGEQMKLVDEFMAGLDHPMTFEHLVSALASTVYASGQSPCAIVLPMEEDPAGLYCHLTDRQGRQYVKPIYPADGEALWPKATDSREFQAAPPHLDWLFDKLEQKLDNSAAQAMPLFAGGRFKGLLLIEGPVEANAAVLSARYGLLCRVATGLIASAAQARQQKGLSEQMVELLGTMQETGYRKTQQEILEGVAEMATGAAHELNNPLSVISGRVQQLQAAEQDPQRKELLDLVRAKTEEMSTIVKDLAEYARPRSPQRRIASLEEILVAAVHQVSRQNAGLLSGLEMGAMGSSADVYVDPAQIAQAVCHVLINASQSYPEGGGTIRIARASVQPSGFAAFTISDDGVGIDPKALPQVFEPFFSFQPAGRRRGMGLAHARRLITLNGGSIRIDSRPGQGTRVTIQLPGV